MVGERVRILICLTALLSDVEGGCSNCRHNKCDKNDECQDGCIPGFAGPKCTYPCSPNCVDSVCDRDKAHGTYPCSIGCSPGFYAGQCNTPCNTTDAKGKCDRLSGTAPDCGGTHYGDDCKTSCLSECGGLVCNNTGACLNEFCIPGWYGDECMEHCEPGCEVCHKDTGKCYKLSAYIDLANSNDRSFDTSGAAHLYSVIIILLIVIVLLIIALIPIIYLMNRIRKSVKEVQREVHTGGRSSSSEANVRCNVDAGTATLHTPRQICLHQSHSTVSYKRSSTSSSNSEEQALME